MDRGISRGDRTASRRNDTVSFVFREGPIEIRCYVSLDALRRQTGVAEVKRERAERLLTWYGKEFERIALARHAAGDLCDGVVVIDSEENSAPVDRHG